ncbi:hypothetical protein, partial [Treponema denticola]|uniref:hypothetical protein n=1 Tax=Treponema denticola TaxID=158 RepID=UPI0005D157B5
MFIPCDYTRIINFCQKESGGSTAGEASRRTASGASRRTAGEASRLNPFFVLLWFIFFYLTA